MKARAIAIISSQRYLDDNIVYNYIEQFTNETPKSITVPCYRVYKIVDGKELYALADGHHRHEAALTLGIPVEYDLGIHPDRIVRDNLLEQCWIDDNWYYLDTGISVW